MRGSETSTGLNNLLVQELKSYSRLMVCGESLSHSVCYSMYDLLESWPKSRRKDLLLLQDACSSLNRFRSGDQKLLTKLARKGVTVCDTADAIADTEVERRENAGVSDFGIGGYLTVANNRVNLEFLRHAPKGSFLAFFSTTEEIKSYKFGRKEELGCGCAKGSRKYFEAVWKFFEVATTKYAGRMKINFEYADFELYGYVPYSDTVTDLVVASKQNTFLVDGNQLARNGLDLRGHSALAVLPPRCQVYSGFKCFTQSHFIHSGNRAGGFSQAVRKKWRYE